MQRVCGKMLDKFLSPFTSIITRLKYGQKFMLISLLFLIPIAILLAIWISTQQNDLKTMKNERIGLEQVEDLMPFILRVQEHRGLVNGYLNGNKEAKAQIEAKQQEISQLIEEIDHHFLEHGLPQSYEKWNSLKKEWEVLLSSYEGLKATESFDRHSDLVSLAKELIVLSADESSLSLDNEINSYYLMKMTVEELPQLIESAAVFRGQGNGVLVTRKLSNDMAVQLQVEVSMSEVELDNLNKSLAKIYELNNTMNEELLKKGEQTVQNLQQFLGLLDEEILNPNGMSMDANVFFEEGTTAIKSAGELFELAAIELDDKLQERIHDITTVRNIFLLITAVVLLLVFQFYVSFYRSVIETVRTLKQRAEAMAQGDFSQDIVLPTKDELQLVGIAFNEMQRSMNRVLSNSQQIAATTFQASLKLSEISNESTMAMQQVAVAVQEVSEGTTSQKRTTAETSATMNEMAIGVQRVAEAASEVAMIAMKANDHADHGNQQLVETVNQMTSIKKTQLESSQIVTKLDEHSAQIEQIIQVIMDIANQTKLLPLNANIEAARAGEHGRGFAVVAQEVGKLAEETSKSGETISELLNVIRSLVGDTVAAMNSMQTETNAGMDSIERSQAAIDRILNEVKLVSERIQEVSATSEEMSAEMEEVTASIAEISDISHQTSDEAENMAAAAEEQLASMEQIQSSAEELRDMSRKLQEDLSKFILREDTAV